MSNTTTGTKSKHGSKKSALISAAVWVVILVVAYFMMVGVPGTNFHGIPRYSASPTATTPG